MSTTPEPEVEDAGARRRRQKAEDRKRAGYPEREPDVQWDAAELYSDQKEHLQKEEGMSEKEAEDALRDDSFETEWDWMLDELGTLMGDTTHWYAEVTGFGWRNLDGHKTFRAEKPREFLRQILPKTDCTFHVWREGDGSFIIRNWHHDSPTGERYDVRPATGDDEDE